MHFGRPIRAVVATGEVEGESGGMLKPGGAQAEEMGATDAQQFGGSIRVQLPAIEGVECLVEKRNGQALGQLMLFKGALNPGSARRARLFVGLRYAPASSKPGPAGRNIPSLILFPPQSHFVPAPTGG